MSSNDRNACHSSDEIPIVDVLILLPFDVDRSLSTDKTTTLINCDISYLQFRPTCVSSCFVSSKQRRLEPRNLAVILILFPFQDVKRPASQKERVGVLRMTFRARKVFGTFEKWAPGQNCIAYAWSNSSKKAFCTAILQRLVHCCCYVQQHVLKEKERIC